MTRDELIAENEKFRIAFQRIASAGSIQTARRIARETLAGKRLGVKAGSPSYVPEDRP